MPSCPPARIRAFARVRAVVLLALALVPPQVAILGAGRIAAQPAVHGGALAVRRLLPLSLTFDHRAVTGAEAARFLATVIEDLARPK